MLVLISPAKNIVSTPKILNQQKTELIFSQKVEILLIELKKYSTSDLGKLLKISTKLAITNYDRFQFMSFPFSQSESSAALFSFNGDVYRAMNIDSFNDSDIEFAQKNLRIISGFYGLLRPLDGIMPYRLEMGTNLKVNNYKNLYEFWGDNIKDKIQEEINSHSEQTIINLASNEYFKAVKASKLNTRIITPVFKEFKNDNYKVVSIYAKQARGMMSSFIIKNKINEPENIKLFDESGYSYNDLLSNENEWVFTRG